MISRPLMSYRVRREARDGRILMLTRVMWQQHRSRDPEGWNLWANQRLLNSKSISSCRRKAGSWVIQSCLRTLLLLQETGTCPRPEMTMPSSRQLRSVTGTIYRSIQVACLSHLSSTLSMWTRLLRRQMLPTWSTEMLPGPRIITLWLWIDSSKRDVERIKPRHLTSWVKTQSSRVQRRI